MASTMWLVFLLAAPAYAAFGPETEVVPPINLNLVAAIDTTSSSMMFGFFASKHYIVLPVAVDTSPSTWVFKFNVSKIALSVRTVAPLTGSLATVFTVRRICQAPYKTKPIDFRVASKPDYTKNNSAQLYYYKQTTQKFYKRTVTVVQDSLCTEVASTAADGDATKGCVQPDTSATACLHQYNNHNGADFTMYAAILHNNVPIGLQTAPICTAGATSQTTPFEFLKLQGYRTDLVANVHFVRK